MDEDLLDYALRYAQSRSVEYAEVRGQSQVIEGFVLRNGVLEESVSAIDSGFCVRIIAGGGIGFASTNRWTEKEARSIVDLAFKYARTARRKDAIIFAEEKLVKAQSNT